MGESELLCDQLRFFRGPGSALLLEERFVVLDFIDDIRTDITVLVRIVDHLEHPL